jgi:hypothetical protein
MVPCQRKQETEMTKLNNETRELNIDELDAVNGGMQNPANFPGFRYIGHVFGMNPSTPLSGNGSFHDTIDNVDGLP